MKRDTGRPRSFSEEDVLESLMQVFWRKGYLGASLNDLTAATGLNKPSLYSSFGDKEQLYLLALERYLSKPAQGPIWAMNEQPNLQSAIRAFLQASVDMYLFEGARRGCFVVTGSSACNTDGIPNSIENALQKAHRNTVDVLRKRFQTELKNKTLPPGQDSDALSLHFAGVVAGLAVKAKAGSSADTLARVIETAVGIL